MRARCGSNRYCPYPLGNVTDLTFATFFSRGGRCYSLLPLFVEVCLPPASMMITRFAALCNTLGIATGSTLDTFIFFNVGNGLCAVPFYIPGRNGTTRRSFPTRGIEFIGLPPNFHVIARSEATHPRVVSLAALRQFTSWQSVLFVVLRTTWPKGPFVCLAAHASLRLAGVTDCHVASLLAMTVVFG